MAVGFHPNPRPEAVLGRVRKNTNAAWPPAEAERTRQDEDADDGGPPKLKNSDAATIRSAARNLRSVGHPEAAKHADAIEALLAGEEDDVEKSLRQLSEPATRAVVEKADAPLRGHIRKLESRLGALHLQKFEGSSAYGDPHARAQIESIRKAELGLGR